MGFKCNKRKFYKEIEKTFMWSSTILTSINRDIIVPITNLIVGEELYVI